MDLAEVFSNEPADLLERLFRNLRREIAQKAFAFPFEDRHIDRAASLAVLVDELVEIRARMRRLVASSKGQRRRQGCLLSTRQDARRSALSHRLFRTPVLIMHGRPLRPTPSGGVQSDRRRLA